jgi:hypothetical protein
MEIDGMLIENSGDHVALIGDLSLFFFKIGQF